MEGRWRVAILFLSVSGCGFIAKTPTMPTPQSGVNATPSEAMMSVRQAVHQDVSPAIRDMPTVSAERVEPHEAEPLRLIPLPPGLKPAEQPDPALQSPSPSPGSKLSPLTAAPMLALGFDGLGDGNYAVSVAPPDTNGAAGLNYYVQWVNTAFAVFDKSTGALVAGPIDGNSLWKGFGGGCETNNNGDPIVAFDRLANRWVLSQFAVRPKPYLQCVAVSTSPDPTGTFYRYSFQYASFDDYPKLGVWPDAYYVTFNLFDINNNFLNAEACAYDRAAMLNGSPATQVCFQLPASAGGGFLPSDLDGDAPPPPGSPNFLLNLGSNALNLYKFHVDFANVANSTFKGPTQIPVAPFSALCNGAGGCVPQPGTTTKLDSLADRLMFRLAYRNFGSHEEMVVNHSVAAGGTGGIRWYEISSPNASPTVVQQGTFAPDSTYRWMGSIAMDRDGDIALGYSAASASTFPSIATTGRTASDSPNSLESETTIESGTGSQTVWHWPGCPPAGCPLTRWGDYSAIQIDPSDDCTFWYTTEYLKATGAFNWSTHIANFRFPYCGCSQKGEPCCGAVSCGPGLACVSRRCQKSDSGPCAVAWKRKGCDKPCPNGLHRILGLKNCSCGCAHINTAAGNAAASSRVPSP